MQRFLSLFLEFESDWNTLNTLNTPGTRPRFFFKMKQKQQAQNTPGTRPSFFKNQSKTNMPGTHLGHIQSTPKIFIANT